MNKSSENARTSTGAEHSSSSVSQLSHAENGDSNTGYAPSEQSRALAALSTLPQEQTENLLLQNMSNTSLADMVYYLNDQSLHAMDNNLSDQVLAILSPPDQQHASDNEGSETSRLEPGATSRKKRKSVLQLPNPPRTAYILFMNSNKEQWLKDNPNVKFNEFQKQSSVIWKQMSPAEKQKWRDEEAEDRKRFLAEVAASSPEVQAQIALAAQGMLRRKEQTSDDAEAAVMGARAGKGPRTAFVIYMQEMRESYMSKNIGITFNEFQTQVYSRDKQPVLIAQMSQQWRALSEEEKYRYVARERAEKAEHMYRSMMQVSNGFYGPEQAMHMEGLRAAMASGDPRNPGMHPMQSQQAFAYVRAEEFHRCLAAMQHDIQVYVSSLAQDFGNQLLMQQEHMHLLLDRSLAQMHAAYSAELSRLSAECARNKSEIEELRKVIQELQKHP